MPLIAAEQLPWLALAVASACAAGIRPFGTAFMLVAGGAMGVLQVPASLSGPFTGPGLLLLAALALAERVADGRALAGQDEDWLLCALRIPAGAVLAGVIAEQGGLPVGWLVLLGAVLAAATQAAKASVRAFLRAVEAPGGAFVVALLVDVGVVAALWMAPKHSIALLACGLLALTSSLPSLVWWGREWRSRVRHARSHGARVQRH